jgi:hypothetical protein
VSFESAQTELKRARRFYEGLGAANNLVAKEEASGAEEANVKETASMVGLEREGNRPEIASRVSHEQILAKRNEHFEGLYDFLGRICDVSGDVRRAYWKLESTPP